MRAPPVSALRLSRPSRWLTVVLASVVLLAGCDFEPSAPPVPAESIELRLRDWINRDLVRGINRTLVQLEVCLDPLVTPEEAEAIRYLDVTFPHGVPTFTVPTTFNPDEYGHLCTRRLFDRQGATLTKGRYTLTVTFDDGRTQEVEGFHDGIVLDPPTGVATSRSTESALIEWSAPDAAHDFVVGLFRLEPDRDVLVAFREGSARGGSFGYSFDFEPEPGATYAFFLGMEGRNTLRRMVYPLP